MAADLLSSLLEAESVPPSRWADLLAARDEFCKYFVQDMIPILVPINLRTRGSRTDHPAGEVQTGVYLMFDRDGPLLYVGVTRRSFNSRLMKHGASFKCYYEDVIPIDNKFRWLACGLECFLIDELKPLINEN